ncbi:MAG: hypothetical protein GEV07_28130 [Streptosporangiales bacterium]|nr:hypothetical protein [Streptosporangiales bacterium]
MKQISTLPLSLPVRAFRLYARYWLPLLVWYLLGRGLHDVLLEVAAHLNRFNAIFAYSAVSVAALCWIAGFVLMFHVVQPALPTVSSLQPSGERGLRSHLRAVGLAMLPFLLVYSSWELFEDDVRRVEYRSWELDPFGSGPERTDFTLWFAGAAVVAWLIVKLMEGITRRTLNPVSALFAAVFEALWMFFAVFGISQLLKAGLAWLGNTLAWQNFAEFWSFTDGLGPILPIRFHDVLGLDFGWLSIAYEPLRNGIILPIAWLAICGVCYGREMEDVRVLVDRRRFARVVERYEEKAPNVVKRWARRFPPAGVREKYYPPLHAIRLMLAASVPALLLFCVFYSLFELGGVVLTQSVVTVIGPHNGGLFWQEVQPLVSMATDAIIESLRVCLLAVTFDLAISRFTAAKDAAKAEPTPEPAVRDLLAGKN